MSSDEVHEDALWAPTVPNVEIPRIGRYTVFSTLGHGGMASIFLARATGKGGFEKWVAIKRPHPHLANRPQIVTMILNEARLVARFEHENICPIIDVDADDSGPYIVMPYLHGEPLAEVMRRFSREKERIPVEVTAHIGAMVANGLHYAHEARDDDGRLLKVIHRDISPQNVFVTFQGSVKVLDFGVAKASGFDANTAIGTLKGKYAYMAPEQARGEELDRRADIFGLGVVLWELLAQKRLFRRETELATADAVLNHRPRLLSEMVEHVPESLAQIVDRALQPDREDRYQTASELGKELRAFLHGQRSFIGTAEMQRFMADAFPQRAQARDPMASSTQPDETVRMAPVSAVSPPRSLSGEETLPPSGIDALELPTETHGLDLPTEAMEQQKIQLETAPTLQLGFSAAQIVERRSMEQTKPAVVAHPPVPRRSASLSEKRFAQGALGVALILLAIAIVLWAERL